MRFVTRLFAYGVACLLAIGPQNARAADRQQKGDEAMNLIQPFKPSHCSLDHGVFGKQAFDGYAKG